MGGGHGGDRDGEAPGATRILADPGATRLEGNPETTRLEVDAGGHGAAGMLAMELVVGLTLLLEWVAELVVELALLLKLVDVLTLLL